MKAIISVFTCDSNRDYFKTCLMYLSESIRVAFIRVPELTLDVHIIDFTKSSNDEAVKEVKSEKVLGAENQIRTYLTNRPGKGFCSNFNYILNDASDQGYDYVVEINDDAFVSSEFVTAAFYLISTKEHTGFIGGVPQSDGIWNDRIERVYIPSMDYCDDRIFNFTRLWWEGSACVVNVKKIGDLRFDEEYDRFLGICGDADFLLRMAKRNIQAWRSGTMRFYHCRGITQAKMGRNPLGNNDYHLKRAQRYFQLKHGEDITDQFKPVVKEMCYEKDFNGKEVKFENDNLLVLTPMQRRLDRFQYDLDVSGEQWEEALKASGYE